MRRRSATERCGKECPSAGQKRLTVNIYIVDGKLDPVHLQNLLYSSLCLVHYTIKPFDPIVKIDTRGSVSAKSQ